MSHRQRKRSVRWGVSLLELIMVVTLAGIVATVAIMRLDKEQTDSVLETSADIHTGDLDMQCQLWFRNRGTWPASDLSDIGANQDYFPTGLPACPLEGFTWRFNQSTRRVEMVAE